MWLCGLSRLCVRSGRSRSTLASYVVNDSNTFSFQQSGEEYSLNLAEVLRIAFDNHRAFLSDLGVDFVDAHTVHSFVPVDAHLPVERALVTPSVQVYKFGCVAGGDERAIRPTGLVFSPKSVKVQSVAFLNVQLFTGFVNLCTR